MTVATRGVQVGFFKSSQGLRNFVKSSHDQVKSGQNLVKSSSQVIKSSRLEHPYRCSSQLFSSQVKSQVKSTGRICFKSSHDQVKSGQNFGQVIKSSHQVKSSSQVIKSSHQVKRLEHPYRCSSQLFSNQVKSQVKSRGRICFKSSHDQVKSGQNFGQVIKSSHQVKRLEHPYIAV